MMLTLCYKLAANVDKIPQEKIALHSLILNGFLSLNSEIDAIFSSESNGIISFFFLVPSLTAIDKNIGSQNQMKKSLQTDIVYIENNKKQMTI